MHGMQIISCDPRARAKSLASLRERLAEAEEDLECAQVRVNASVEDAAKALEAFKVDLRCVLALRDEIRKAEQ